MFPYNTILKLIEIYPILNLIHSKQSFEIISSSKLTIYSIILCDINCMCWNKQVSFITFIAAICGVYYLWKRNGQNDRWMAVFAGTIAMIQLAEYFMWSDPKCGKVNAYASAFALLVLAAEPLMNMVGGLYFERTSNKKILQILLGFYAIFILYLGKIYFDKKDKQLCGQSSCEKGENILGRNGCNLKWRFMENFGEVLGVIWVFFLLIPFLAMLPMVNGVTLFGLGFLSMGIALMYNKTALGSLWCWFSIGIIVYQIMK